MHPNKKPPSHPQQPELTVFRVLPRRACKVSMPARQSGVLLASRSTRRCIAPQARYALYVRVRPTTLRSPLTPAKRRRRWWSCCSTRAAAGHLRVQLLTPYRMCSQVTRTLLDDALAERQVQGEVRLQGQLKIQATACVLARSGSHCGLPTHTRWVGRS